MNRILMNNGKKMELNKEIFLDHDLDVSIVLDDVTEDLTITIDKNVNCKITLTGENINNNFNIILLDNSFLHIDSFIINNNGNISVSLDGRFSIFELNYSLIASRDCHVKFDVNHNAPDTKSNIVNSGCSFNNKKLVFDVNGTIEKESSNCICNQDSKIISDNSLNTKIFPNLYIDNNDVEANHSAYIGSVSDSEMFYLMSRGISRNEAYKLLVKAFLIGKMQLKEDDNNKILSLIDEYIGKEDECYES